MYNFSSLLKLSNCIYVYNLLDKIVPMRDVFAEQIMMICFAIFGRHDIYKFVGDINSLTKDADKKTERLGVWLGSGEGRAIISM